MNTHTADLEALWHSHHRKIGDYIGRHVFHVEDSQDLLSSVYLRALVAMCNGNGYTSSASGWMWQITRSVIRDYWRQMERRGWAVELDADISDSFNDELGLFRELNLELVSTEPSPHECAEREHTARVVRRAVSSLPPAQEDVMAARLEGYDLPEIAVHIGKSYNATKQLSVRAHANLRPLLAKEAA